MRKKTIAVLFSGAMALSFSLFGCGGGSSVSSTGSASKVSGVATTDTAVAGTVSVKDSSTPAQEKTVSTAGNGWYTVNTNGMTAPYVLKSAWTDTAGSHEMYSLAAQNGRTNINPVTDAALMASSDNMDAAGLYNAPSRERYERSRMNFRSIIDQLRTVLAPLFALYQTTDPVTDDDGDSEGGADWLRAMFKDVSFVVKSGNLIVTNRKTGGIIYQAPLSNVTSGTLDTANLPGTTSTPPSVCSYTYSAWGACIADGTQLRTVLTSTPAGCSGTPVLSQSCTYAPPPTQCTYTYSAWGACQSDSTQSRTVLSSAPAGCTGTPVLTQGCSYTPPTTTCTSFTYSAWGACQSDNTQSRTVVSSLPSGCTGGSPVLTQACTYVPPVTTCTSFTYSAWGACQSNNTQTRTVVSSSPSGCTGGSPVLTQACTYVPPVTTCTSFAYSAWGACQSNNTQARTVVSSLPAGCTGGSPVLTQACTYVPPTCTSFTYSAWGACTNNTQTRTVVTSLPAGCSGGSPVLSQSCTSNPVTMSTVQSTCTQCHGLTVNTTVFKSGGFSVSGRTASAWVTALTGMFSPPAGTTVQNFADFLITVP
ncbi:MAG TPA: hypothetical protein VK654_17705 [Nitrospirota bacterium]|nr:hypothetical protein [Nitrospirota bacterium]